MAYNLQKLFAEIDTQLSENPRLSLKELAMDLAVERHTIERATHEVACLSFRQYRERKFLVQALVLLTQRGSISVKEIGLALGYQSPDAFGRFIKNATGKTPTEIRGGGIKLRLIKKN